MIVEFVCKTNYDYPEINTATFYTVDGEIVIDRHKTLYSYDKEKHELTMTWFDVYILDEDEIFDYDEDIFDDASFLYFDIEDDAPEDYECEFVSVEFYTEEDE